MFEYFPGNYWWSAMLLNSLGMGGEMTEIDRAVSGLRETARSPIGATEKSRWGAAWFDLGGQVRALAEADEANGLTAGARRKYLRAAGYMFAAEVINASHDGDPEKVAVYDAAQDTFKRGAALERNRVEFVEVPFEDTSLPAIYAPAEGVGGPAPCMVHFDGKDDVKEVTYLRHRDGLAQRGIGVLIVDHPGSGEAVRKRGLYARPDIEKAASAAVDYLEGREEVDADRIGIIAQSFGGYYAPRSAAFEKRFKCCVVWGAMWDVNEAFFDGEVTHDPDEWLLLGRLPDADAVRDRLEAFSLEDSIEKVECALLVFHGENDRQVPLWTAERTVERAVNAASAELRVFTQAEGGAEHCELDLFTQATDYVADWLDLFFTTYSDAKGTI